MALRGSTPPSTTLLTQLRTGTPRALVALFLIGAGAARAEVALRPATEDGHPVLVMENETWRLTVWPDRGGRVGHAVHKPTGNDWVYPQGGLFLDHVTQQVWPGELLDVPYEYEIRAPGPEQATVRLWRTIKGDGNAAIAGVVFEKELTLKQGDPRLHAVLRLRNPADAPRSPVPWSQHCFFVGGSKENDHYFRPATTGVLEAWANFTTTETKRSGTEFVREPVAGWTAVTDSVTGEGAAFLMRYNDLFWLYNCIGSMTVEWWYDPIPLPPGASWETEVTVIPFVGLKSVAYADERVVASLEPNYRDGRLSVSLDALAASSETVKQVSGELTLVSYPEGKTLKTESIALGDVGQEAAARQLDLGPLAKTQAVVVRVRLQGEGCTASFERHFDPLAAEKAQFGQVSATYRVPKPKKEKQFALDPAARVQVNLPPRVLICEGLHTNYWRLDQALKSLGADPPQIAHHTIFVYGDQLDYMPASPAELLQYDLIVLSNIPAEALTDVGQAFLKLYVERGGGLLVLGGSAAYGAGSYGETDLGALLPVMTDGRFDRVSLGEGAALAPVGKLGGELFWGWPSGPEAPRALWLHKTAGVRPEGEVVLRAGRWPAVVVGPYGQGHVAAVLLTPWGDPPAGTTGFWQWAEWPRWLGRLMDWLRPRPLLGLRD